MESTLCFYVSTKGSDGFSGRIEKPEGNDGPVKTIGAVLKQLRHLRLDGAFTKGVVDILVEPGIYESDKPVLFELEDLGNPDLSIRIRKNGEGEARFVGGFRLTGYEKHEGKILKIDMIKQGLPDVFVKELFCNGERMRKARYPKYRADNPYGAGWLFVPGRQTNFHEEGFGHPNEFTCADPRLKNWKHIDEAEIFIFPRFNWFSDTVPVKSYDPEAGRVSLARDCSQPIHPTDRYYFQNVFEELTDPGEWYYDRMEHIVYFIAPEGAKELVLTVPVSEYVFEVRGEPLPAENLFGGRIDMADAGGPQALGMDWNTKPLGFLSFEHLVLEGCSSCAALIRHAHYCQIVGCTVRNTGGHGIIVLKGRNNRIAGCDIYDTGCNAIYISGGYRSPHAGFYRDSGHVIDNNYIHHVGRNYRSSSAIDANGLGIRISHNLIHDTPRTGIHTRGNRNIIEYNHIHHVNIETNDAAAINLCDRDLTMHDTKIRYNRLHDVMGLRLHDGVWDPAYFTFGIYLDDFSAGVDIYGNLIYRTPNGGVFTHANQDVRVFNNIIVNPVNDMLFMRRWGKGLEYERLGTHGIAMRRNTYVRNILASSIPGCSVYKLENCMDENWELDMETNEINQNLIWSYGRPMTLDVSQDLGFEHYDRWQDDYSIIKQKGFDADSLYEDPMFVDPEHDDYRLKPGSPAFQLGFEPLPVDEMGTYQSPERASWPIVEVSGAADTPVVIENFHEGI